MATQAFGPLSPADQTPQQCTVTGTHAYALMVSSIFGMAPLRFRSRGNGYAVSLSKYMRVYSYLLLTSSVGPYLAGLAIYGALMLGRSPSEPIQFDAATLVFLFGILMIISISIVGILGASNRMRSMIRFINTIASVDESIGALYSRARERRRLACLVLYLVFAAGLTLFDLGYFISDSSFNAIPWTLVVSRLLYCMVFTFEIQFSFTALAVHTRFKAVNDALSLVTKYLSDPDPQKEMNLKTMSIPTIKVKPIEPRSEATAIIKKTMTGEPHLVVSPDEAVERIAPMVGALYDVVHTINDSYSTPLIFTLLSTLIYIIVPSFCVLGTTQEHGSVPYITVESLWSVFFMLRLFSVVEPGHYTIVESQKSERLVSRMLLVSPSAGPLTARLQLFQRQLAMQPLAYSPMGLCSLNRSLIASMLGAAVTYLVILLQFHQSGN